MLMQPTPERVRHAGPDGIVEVDTAQAGVKAARVRDMLERYWKRELLAPKQPDQNARRYMAGVRLREAWDHGGLDSLPVVCMLTVDGTRDPERRIVSAIDKSAEFWRMFRMVGTACEWSVWGVVVRGEDIGRGGPMERLRLGLAQLANGLRIP